jgi:hypothetical protein
VLAPIWLTCYLIVFWWVMGGETKFVEGMPTLVVQRGTLLLLQLVWLLS